MISAIVQIGLALPMVEYFHRVGISGLSANAFIVPLMGLVVPIGFMAVLTGWAWIAKIAGGLLWLSQIVVSRHAVLEPNWRIPTPPLWLAATLAAVLIGAAIVRPVPATRIAAGLMAAILLALIFRHPFVPDTRAGQLEMTAIDVGQGDSILIVFPNGKRLLVDGGGLASFGRQRANESRYR